MSILAATPKAHTINCNKCRGGKKPLWQAHHPDHRGIVGAGNTADNAIKDFQKQLQRFMLWQALQD